ncbi:MAG: ATP-binding protein [Bacteroidota bacterium]
MNPNSTPLSTHSSLKKHLDWFAAFLEWRIQHYFETSTAETTDLAPEAPPLQAGSPLDQLFIDFALGWEEKLIVLLALVPHLRPQVLDVLLSKNPNLGRSYTEFGGLQNEQQNGFLPTHETAVFLIAGSDLTNRIAVIKLLEKDHPLFRHAVLEARLPAANAAPLSRPLQISKIFLPVLLWNRKYTPAFASDFPAKKMTTSLDWNDLILNPRVMDRVLEIKAWLQHEEQILHQWNLQRLIKPGFRSLFFGPPGTGKTLTAALLGKTLGMEVYRIDLAMVISKYIGETEKNLAQVFDLAERQAWILFFDEADALFGKRSLTKSSNDRYANQEVSYLLQRIEDFSGLIILASNFKDNLDEAFTRRFQSMIHFPIPDAKQRLRLWQQAFNEGLTLAPKVDLSQLAQQYEITGGMMINVLRYVAIRTAQRADQQVEFQDLIEGIKREFQKTGRIMN